MNNTTLKALVVEDTADIRSAARLIAEELSDATVDEAANGADGLAMLTRQRYDVLFLDMTMPVLVGQELS